MKLAFIFTLIWLDIYPIKVLGQTLCHSSHQYTIDSCHEEATSSLVAHSRQSCEIEMASLGCDDLKNEFPGAGLRNCEADHACENQQLSTKEFLLTCLSQSGKAWKDSAASLYQTIFEGVPVEDSLKQKQDFLKSCTTVECKRDMLGNYQYLFTKEEIEGSQADSIDCNDVVNQNNCQGYSAAVLYRQTIKKIKTSVPGSMNEPFILPWTSKPYEAPVSLSAQIDLYLAKLGIQPKGCFKPKDIVEARCYLAFAILDPLIFAGAAVAGVKLIKAGVHLTKLSRTKSVTERLKIALSPKDFELAQSLAQKAQQGKTLSLEEGAKLGELINTAGIRGQVAFHHTNQQGLAGITASSTVRGKKGRQRVYAFPYYRPENLSLRTGIVGQELDRVVMFQGEAAALFDNIPIRGVHSGIYGRLQGSYQTTQQIGQVRIIESEFKDGVLIVKKAQIEKVSPGQALVGQAAESLEAVGSALTFNYLLFSVILDSE